MDDLRGTPMSVGTLEEIIDDNHAIVSTSVGSEHYVSILSFVDKDLLEPGCSVLLNHKVTLSTRTRGKNRNEGSFKRLDCRIVLGSCCDRSSDGRHRPVGDRDEGGESPTGNLCGHRRTGQPDPGN